MTRLLLRRMVERLGHTCAEAADGVAAWASYQSDIPDVIISDWRMPGLEGPELCRRVRAREAEGTYTYFILLTGLQDREHAIRGLEVGADDYLGKPPDANEIELRLLVAARVSALHQRLAQREAALWQLASTDDLTGLPNRRVAEDRLREYVGLARREAKPLTLAMLDLDHFKRVNDTYGHATGDGVLKAVAQLLREAMREHDVVARWGGEEFLLGLYGAPAAGCMQRVSALLARVRQHAFTAPGGQSIPVTLSAGVAAYPANGTDLDGLVAAADHALYQAKAAGRDRVHLASAHAGRAPHGSSF